MFQTLDRVKYHSLELNHPRRTPHGSAPNPNPNPNPHLNPHPYPNAAEPGSLVQIVCNTMVSRIRHDGRLGVKMMSRVFTYLPHLAFNFLDIAVNKLYDMDIVRVLIVFWPMEVLCLRQVVAPHRFDVSLYNTLILAISLNQRVSCFRLRSLDLRGFQLDTEQMLLPLLAFSLCSIRRDTEGAGLDVSDMTRMVMRRTGLDTEETRASWTAGISDIVKYCTNLVNVRNWTDYKGAQLVVKMDRVVLRTYQVRLCYLITRCLWDRLAIRVQPSQLVLPLPQSYLVAGEWNHELSRSYFRILNCHETETLRGLALSMMVTDNKKVQRKNFFTSLAVCLTRFKNLQALDLRGCTTLMKWCDRNLVCASLTSLSQLIRLDLRDTDLTHFLGRVLRSLRQSLEYLNLRRCHLHAYDLCDLAASKHATSLLELDLSGVKFHFAVARSKPEAMALELILALDRFPSLVILDLEINHLPDHLMEELCRVLTNHFSQLKALLLHTPHSYQCLMAWLAKACGSIPCFQKLELRLSKCTTHLAAGVLDKVTRTLETMNRGDVECRCSSTK